MRPWAGALVSRGVRENPTGEVNNRSRRVIPWPWSRQERHIRRTGRRTVDGRRGTAGKSLTRPVKPSGADMSRPALSHRPPHRRAAHRPLGRPGARRHRPRSSRRLRRAVLALAAGPEHHVPDPQDHRRPGGVARRVRPPPGGHRPVDRAGPQGRPVRALLPGAGPDRAVPHHQGDRAPPSWPPAPASRPSPATRSSACAPPCRRSTPIWAAEEHAAPDLEQRRTRARRLALSLLELGETGRGGRAPAPPVEDPPGHGPRGAPLGRGARAGAGGPTDRRLAAAAASPAAPAAAPPPEAGVRPVGRCGVTAGQLTSGSRWWA